MKSISSILNSASSSSPLVRGVTAAMTVETANRVLAEMFGQEIARFVSAAYVKNQVLTVACLSSTAAQEIKLREQHFIEQINNQVGKMVIQRVSYLS